MNYKRYIWIFSAWLIGTSIVLAIVITVFPGFPFLSGAVILPFACAMETGEMFVEKERRIPDEREISILVNRSFMVVVLFNLVVLTLFYSRAFSSTSGGGPSYYPIVLWGSQS